MSLPPKHTATFSILSEEILFLFAASKNGLRNSAQSNPKQSLV